MVPWTVRSTAVCEEVLAGINGLGGYPERLLGASEIPRSANDQGMFLRRKSEGLVV